MKVNAKFLIPISFFSLILIVIVLFGIGVIPSPRVLFMDSIHEKTLPSIKMSVSCNYFGSFPYAPFHYEIPLLVDAGSDNIWAARLYYSLSTGKDRRTLSLIRKFKREMENHANPYGIGYAEFHISLTTEDGTTHRYNTNYEYGVYAEELRDRGPQDTMLYCDAFIICEGMLLEKLNDRILELRECAAITDDQLDSFFDFSGKQSALPE